MYPESKVGNREEAWKWNHAQNVFFPERRAARRNMVVTVAVVRSGPHCRLSAAAIPVALKQLYQSWLVACTVALLKSEH